MAPISQAIDVSKIQQGAQTYDKTLRALPFVGLSDVASILHLNVMELAGKHTLINKRRNAGGTQAYAPGKDFAELTKLLGFDPSSIEPKLVACVMKENAASYNDDVMAIVAGRMFDPKTKKHPMEYEILQALVLSHMEDVVYSMFSAERDEEQATPITAFDGFYTKIDALIESGEINAAKGNYALSGEFSLPTSETDFAAYENLVEWLAGANSFLRSNAGGVPQLLCSQHVISCARAALRNKLRMQEYPSVARLTELLREDAFIPGLIICSHEALGNGSRLILQKVGNMDLAINTKASSKFVQIRDIYEDPNEFQFWLQAGYDTRVRDWHSKVFRTNEQQNTPNDLAGDYTKGGAVQINITGDGGKGKWFVQGTTQMRASGQYAIGLSAGQHTINFAPVSEKTEPHALTVTVKDGEVTVQTAAYT